MLLNFLPKKYAEGKDPIRNEDIIIIIDVISILI